MTADRFRLFAEGSLFVCLGALSWRAGAAVSGTNWGGFLAFFAIGTLLEIRFEIRRQSEVLAALAQLANTYVRIALKIPGDSPR